jgi:glutamine cyclotransferase
MRFSPRYRPLLLFPFLLVFAAHVSAADTYRIVHSYPHDPHAFTQGLVYADGQLYESTGLYGQSSLRMVDLETGRALQTLPVAARYFAEGLTTWGSTLIQLTWQEHTALVYDRFSFRELRSLSFTGEGWGLTEDGKALILSDGSAHLRFLDPSTLRELRTITVTDRGKPVTELNELEYIHGEIYANVWHSDRIARIAPATGEVLGWIDLTGLLPAAEHSTAEAVLNGIAYDATHDRLFVTGKLWPKLFEIKVVPASPKSVKAMHRK